MDIFFIILGAGLTALGLMNILINITNKKEDNHPDKRYPDKDKLPR